MAIAEFGTSLPGGLTRRPVTQHPAPGVPLPQPAAPVAGRQLAAAVASLSVPVFRVAR
jgi:hypothetical protein